MYMCPISYRGALHIVEYLYYNLFKHVAFSSSYNSNALEILYCNIYVHVLHIYPLDGSVQKRRNSIADALELRLSCTNPSIYDTFPP